VRVVRVPTNRPAIAGVAIGRAAPPVPAAVPAASAANAAPADTTVAAASAVTDPSQRPAAQSKKPQKAAQTRRREPAPSWREVRAPVNGASPQGPIGFGGFFSMFR